MKAKSMDRKVHSCLRCGHRWFGSVTTAGHRPKQCPYCHNRYWDRERMR